MTIRKWEMKREFEELVIFWQAGGSGAYLHYKVVFRNFKIGWLMGVVNGGGDKTLPPFHLIL
jgi:hypothetical protein